MSARTNRVDEATPREQWSPGDSCVPTLPITRHAKQQYQEIALSDSAYTISSLYHPIGHANTVPKHNRASKTTKNWLKYLIGPIIFVTNIMGPKRRKLYNCYWQHQYQPPSNHPSFIESSTTRAFHNTIERRKRPNDVGSIQIFILLTFVQLF